MKKFFSRKAVKALIELSTSFEQADEVICKHVGLNSVDEKIAYLKGMFDIEIFHSTDNDANANYRAMLESIIRS